MNKKDFLKLFESIKDTQKPIKMAVYPYRGDKLKIECGVTFVTPSNSTRAIHISNIFSRKYPILTVREFIDKFPNEEMYDSFKIVAHVSSFSGKVNTALIFESLTDNNVNIKEFLDFVEISIMINYL